jgi:hypothetical protein
MIIKGVNYDVDRVLLGHNMRPTFDPKIIHRELEIIKNDLKANSVKIQGYDISNVMKAGKHALEVGLDVWLAPELFDKSPEETLEYTVKAAEEAEKLRSESSEKELVFSVGTELTGFMNGIVEEGNNVMERFSSKDFRENVKSGKYSKLLNDYLAKVICKIREIFKDKVTYASLPRIESIDWTLFDYVCIDAYRDRFNKNSYGEIVKQYLKFGKPVVIGEFGCCTYRGAEEMGGMGWDIVDFSKMPPQLKGEYVYDQELQARELENQLEILDNTGVYGAFVFTFVQPLDLSKDPFLMKILRVLHLIPTFQVTA